MQNQKNHLNEYLQSLLSKGFHAVVSSEFVQKEAPLTTCIHTHLQRAVVRIRNTVNFYYDDEVTETPIVGGEFDTLLEVLLDDDGSIYQVREESFYNTESIQLKHSDADFLAVVEQTGNAANEVYFDMVNKLLHGSPFQMITLTDDAFELMSWGSYCDNICLPDNLLSA